MPEIVLIAAPAGTDFANVHALLSQLPESNWVQAKQTKTNNLEIDYDNYQGDDIVENEIDAIGLETLKSEVEGAAKGSKTLFISGWPVVNELELYLKAFPEAKVIPLVQKPVDVALGALAGWSSQKAITHNALPDWWGDKWSFGLLPNWRDFIGEPIPSVVAAQWAHSQEKVLKISTDGEINKTMSFEALMLDPKEEISRVFSAHGIDWNDLEQIDTASSERWLKRKLPEGWQGRAGEALSQLSKYPDILSKTQELRVQIAPKDELVAAKPARPGSDAVTRPASGTPFQNKHTTTFVDIIKEIKSSLIVTTYKSGHSLMIRADENGLNTAIRQFNRPMGVAIGGSRLAIGTGTTIETYTNQPRMTNLLEPKGKHDAVFAPRSSVQTGDVAIHEMEWGMTDEYSGLWFINTKFSCLCKQDLNYSFEPVWKPRWITKLAAEDRCHLNGLAMKDGKPKYVTALSQTDTANGWRDLKGIAGVIIDVETDEVVTEGLSMPHSPRLHQGKLWVLESGKGTLATVDIDTGNVTTVATLPGFTRGLAFAGNIAFIGLSQVRESVFSELPVTKTKDERNCGVWVVNIKTGQILGFMKFEGAIQEIFDVKLLPGAKWPSIIDTSQATAQAYVLSEEALKMVAK